MTGLVELVDERLDVRGHLGLQRRREHLPRTIADQLVQQRPTHRGRGVLLGLVLLVDYPACFMRLTDTGWMCVKVPVL